MWKTVDKRKPGRVRRFLFQGGICLITAVIISAAYLVFMFQWTSAQINYKEAYHWQIRENMELEASFRAWVGEKEKLVEAAGYEAKAQRIEGLTGLREEIMEEMGQWNQELAPPLEPGSMNMRSMILELLKQKREAEKVVAAARAEVDAVRENFEIERSDFNLQSQIYMRKIERLEERIGQIEQR